MTRNGFARTVPLARDAAEIFHITLSNPVRALDTDLISRGEPSRDGNRRPYEFRLAWQREVGDVFGHKSMHMRKRYTHLRAGDLVGRLDQLFGL